MTAAFTFAAALAVAHAALDIMVVLIGVVLIGLAFRTRCARCRQVIEQ